VRALRVIATGASIVAALGMVPGAAAQPAKPTPHAVTPHAASNHGSGHDDASHPHVYLMRGLLNIFSLGMDQLAAQIARNGIDASVYNHSVEETVVGTIVQKYRAGDRGPYILVGHSLGADAVMLMAQQLNAQGVPVALVVPFDGTESYTAPGNVSCVVNLTQRKYAYMQAGAGFHGKLSNVDVSQRHHHRPCHDRQVAAVAGSSAQRDSASGAWTVVPSGYKRSGCRTGETARTQGDRASRQRVQRKRDQRQRAQAGKFADERRAGQEPAYERKERPSGQDNVTGQGHHTGEERRLPHRAGQERHHTG
jgi:hypothetical protein